MKLKITPALQVTSDCGKQLQLMPAPMKNGFPSREPRLWLQFLRADGQRLAISTTDCKRVQAYMREHGTEALSDDGVTAFTIASNSLIECRPAVCGDIDERAVA